MAVQGARRAPAGDALALGSGVHDRADPIRDRTDRSVAKRRSFLSAS
jgi:hypothetical protein